MVFFLAIAFATNSLWAQRKPAKPSVKNGIAVLPMPAQRKVEIRIKGKLFTAYQFPESVKKPVLWPIIAKNGLTVTRGYPLQPQAGERVDHPHHVGLWFNHGDVNGLDFWNNSDQIGPEHKGPFGEIVHHTIDTYYSGKTKAGLTVTMFWQNQHKKPLIKEKTEFVFQEMGNIRTIDRLASLEIMDDSVRIRDNKEGMLGLRVARFLEHKSKKNEYFVDKNGVPTQVPMLDTIGVNGHYLSSEGVSGEDVWGKRASWVALSGQKDGKAVTVILFDHPENYNYPGHWHARGYGLFALNSIGTAVFEPSKQTNSNLALPPHATLLFRHRVLIVSGKPPKPEQIQSWHKAWVSELGQN